MSVLDDPEPVPAACPDCNRGYTWAREWVFVIAQRFGMLAGDLEDQKHNRPMHPWLAQDAFPAAHAKLLPTQNPLWGVAAPVRPTLDIIPLLEGLTNETWYGGIGDDIETITRAIIRAAGLDPKVWGVCATCEGHGMVNLRDDDTTETT